MLTVSHKMAQMIRKTHWEVFRRCVLGSTLHASLRVLIQPSRASLECFIFNFQCMWKSSGETFLRGSSPASVVFVLSSLALTKLWELWFFSLRSQHAGCFDADLCAHRNEGRDEEQTACDGGSPSPRLPSDTGVDTGERMSAVTMAVRRGGGRGGGVL